jgi:hypothetical protein
MENTSKNFFETITEMQKKVVENFNVAGEKMQNNFFKNDYMDSDPFKKWYDSQMSFFNQSSNAKGESDPMKFFNSWLENQTNFANTWKEQIQSTFTKAGKDFNAMPNMDMYSNWMDTMNNTYTEMMKNFGGKNESMNSFSGMFNNSQNYMKMFQIWMPMMSSLKDKSFTPEMFQNMFKPELFKGFMDSIFNMQPEYMKEMMNKFNSSLKEGMDSFSKQGKDSYKSFSEKMHKGFAGGEQTFEQFNTLYKNYSDALNQAFSPIMKMVTPGNQKDQINLLNNLSNDFSQYNMLNSKMQYMMYTTGVKTMEEVSENVFSKMKEGVDMSDFKNVYQEWLNINDKNFVTLFDSSEYSKLQGEFNAIDMKIKKAVNTQWEKSLAHLPLINRTEMDELYKTIYDLKKQVSELVKINKTAQATAQAKTEATSKETTPKETAPVAKVTPAPSKSEDTVKATAKPASKKA